MAICARLIASVVICLASVGCPGKPKTSVLLISIDSLRTDHVHACGYARETTPALDRLAREGTLWTGIVAPAPWTTPSMMAVMTGLSPDLHHVEEDDRVIDAAVPMLAERFRSAGYATAGFVPSATLTARFGFSRGFDLYDERDFGHRAPTSPAQASAVIAWLEKVKTPFFGWVHLWDPHYNYNAPAPYNARFPGPAGFAPPPEGYDLIQLKSHRTSLLPDAIAYITGQYDGEIAYTDHYISEILEALSRIGKASNTLVVVLGDHGEAFQEHGWLTHTNTVYEETIRVPVIARLPGVLPAGTKVTAPRSLVDLTESLAGWSGLRSTGGAPRTLPLTDPVEPLDSAGPPAPSSPMLISTTRRQATVLSARIGAWSLIVEYDLCRFELYDLLSDPGQTRDLAVSRPEILSAMREQVKHRITSERREHPVPVHKIEEQDPELFRKLGALGYADLFGDKMGKRSDADPLRCL